MVSLNILFQGLWIPIIVQHFNVHAYSNSFNDYDQFTCFTLLLCIYTYMLYATLNNSIVYVCYMYSLSQFRFHLFRSFISHNFLGYSTTCDAQVLLFQKVEFNFWRRFPLLYTLTYELSFMYEGSFYSRIYAHPYTCMHKFNTKMHLSIWNNIKCLYI